MALFKVNRGNEANLPSKLTDGWAYFCTDTGSFLIDHYDSTNTLVRSKVNAEYSDKLRYVENGETLELTPEEIITVLSNKVDKIDGMGLSTNDYTTAEKYKLEGIEEGATRTIVDPEMSATSTNPVQNKVVQEQIETLQANIDTHANSTDNPHNVTIEQIGAAAAVHEHDAGTDITSGILPITYGGTGNDSGYVRIGQKAGTTVANYATAEGQDTTATGWRSHAEGWGTTASNSSTHAEGKNTTASGSNAHAEGESTIASGSAAHAEGNSTNATTSYTHAEGNSTTASGIAAHAEGCKTIAGSTGDISTTTTYTDGYYTHAEGYGSVATGRAAHAEGHGTLAIGMDSHTEGYKTYADGRAGHAEGYETKADHAYTHAEGYQTVASAQRSHSEGYCTIAASENQHVQGKYNIEDSAGVYAHIVGNGNYESSRSNAHTLDWNGNAWFKGKVYVGGSSQSGGTALASTMSLTTAEYETMSTNNELQESTLYMLTDDTYEEDLQATVDGMNSIDYDTYLAFDTTEIV